MIPYFQWLDIPIGPVSIQVWGLCVATGILAALWISLWAGKKRNLDRQIILDAASWIVVASLVGGRFIYVLTEWNLFAENIGDIFAIWKGGMSISGGFLGALLVALWYLRKKKVSFVEYGDVLILGLPIGLFIGRLGCFFIFDHPGAPTTFFLGQTYIDGIVRHNHGLYLSLQGLFLACIFYFVWMKKNTPKGIFLVLFSWVYGSTRFILDFFRATDLSQVDAKFAGLTFARYFSIALVIVGTIVWYTIQRKRLVKS